MRLRPVWLLVAGLVGAMFCMVDVVVSKSPMTSTRLVCLAVIIPYVIQFFQELLIWRFHKHFIAEPSDS